MTKLIFGDPKSIALRDSHEKKLILEKLNDSVKCPFCGSKNVGHFEIDMKEERIGWNFDCKPECPNSFESSEESPSGSLDTNLYTNFKGKFINY